LKTATDYCQLQWQIQRNAYSSAYTKSVITRAKKVMLSHVSVCLFVSRITQKLQIKYL